MNQSHKRSFIAVLIFIGFLLFMAFWGIDLILGAYAGHKLSKLAERHHLDIRYDKIRLMGLSTVRMEGLTVIPIDADTLIHADRLQAKLELGRLLLLTPAIESVQADNLHIHFIKKGERANFDFLYKPSNHLGEPEETAVDDKEQDYARKAERSLSLLFNLLPGNALVHDLCVSYSNKGDELILEIPELNLANNQFSTHINSTENGVRSEWICEGSLSDKERLVKARLYADEHTKIPLPFLEYRWGASVRFDTLAFELKGPKIEEDIQSLLGSAYVSGLTIHQERISPDTVLLDKGSIHFRTNIGKNYIELDSVSDIRFNHLDFHPYLKIVKDTSWQIMASVNKRDFPADQLFSSLPKGLFYNLEGLRTKGTLSYHFRLDLDFGQVDSLILESTLKANGFQILAYGNTDLRKMNEPFEYTVYEQGEPVRSFEIGPANPSFRPFNAVSRYLPLAIMQSEDAGFFYHNGFIPSAIRESLIQDIKERRFARGGSTLSMQLVKNVFLSRNKTIARKLEEMLIVWLIESDHLTSKERMFEVYLNIAEWGPMIYGAAEASRYYFAKEPSQLNLAECIFMASIIPKPKQVRYCFDGLRLKPYYEDFYRVILDRLVDRGLISSEEAVGVTPESVEITGPAKEYLTATQSRSPRSSQPLDQK